MKTLRRTWQIFLEILFPSVCLNCRAYLKEEIRRELLCEACFNGIKIFSNVFYPDPRFKLVALGSYENTALRELLHYFKYSSFLAAQTPLEKLILKWLEINRNLIPNILLPDSCLTPIPLHPNRLRSRGFNQSELIAEILARHLNLPVEKNLLKRVRNTKSQVEMKDLKKRAENLKNSFVAKESDQKSVILVDDIYTSGATMGEAARALRRAGAKNITAFVIAKT